MGKKLFKGDTILHNIISNLISNNNLRHILVHTIATKQQQNQRIKVSNSQKQNMLSSILPKNKQQSLS